MNAPHAATTRYVLHVTWHRNDDAPQLFWLDEVASVRSLVDEHSLWPTAFESDCPDFIELLEHLEPLADPDLDEITVNGETIVVAERPTGGYAFVPCEWVEGVEPLMTGSSVTDGDAPCVWVQVEEILRYGDLYWVEARGDTLNRRVLAGRFDDPTAGCNAAIALATFFSLDADGEPACELGESPDDLGDWSLED